MRRRCAALIEDCAIEFAEFVPMALRHLVAHLQHTGEKLHTLRFLVAGSDLWHAEDLRRTREVVASAAHRQLLRAVEAAVDSTCVVYGPGDALPAAGIVPIGRPLSNASAFVLNAAGLPCPIGAPGELLHRRPVTGAWLPRPARTHRRAFRHPPLRSGPALSDGRPRALARRRLAGDLGAHRSQVKIRGFRVELGDIESCLKAHPAVKEAVVVDVLRGADDRQLAAYVGLRGDMEPAAATAALRAHPAASLPDYMVPAALSVLAALPAPIRTADRPPGTP
jgi:non-ribosomal peptide synthetase component F